MENMRRPFLKSKYNELALKHADIVKVNPEAINIIQCQLNDLGNVSGIKYYILVLGASLTIGSAPILISIYYEYCKGLESILFGLLSKQEYLLTHLAINLSLLSLAVCIPIYTLVFPFHNFFQKIFLYNFFKKIHLYILRGSFFNKKSRLYQLIKINIRRYKLDASIKKDILRVQRRPFTPTVSKTFYFYIFILILNYSAALVPLLYLISFNAFSESILHTLLLIWLILPSPIVAIAPGLFFVTISVVISNFMAPHHNINYDIKVLPSLILVRLLVLLESIDNLKESDFVDSRRIKIANNILGISSMISRLGGLYTSNSLFNEQVNEKFSNAANAFESLIFFIMLPKPDSIAQLKRYTIRMINIFLTGNLGNLPQEPYVGSVISPLHPKIGMVKRALSIFGLLIYLVVPIALWMFATNHLDLNLNDVSKTLLTVLYSLWAVTGIITFSSALASEVKALLISILRQNFKTTD
jgi:hypothetical protein